MSSALNQKLSQPQSLRFAVLDLETTSLGPDREIIELCILTCSESQILSEWESFFRPSRLPAKKILELTGLTKYPLEAAGSIADKIEEIREVIQDHILVSHHFIKDAEVLRPLFEAQGYEFRYKWLCTWEWSQRLFPHLSHYGLAELARHFAWKERPNHRARQDALVTARLLFHLLFQKDSQLTDFLAPKKKTLLAWPSCPGIAWLKQPQSSDTKIVSTSHLAQTIKDFERQGWTCYEVERTGSWFMAELLKAQKLDRPLRYQISQNSNGQFFVEKAHRQRAPWFMSATYWGGQKELHKWRKSSTLRAKAPRTLTDPLLLWGPGRKEQEWSYALCFEGQLQSWGYSDVSPEIVLENPYGFRFEHPGLPGLSYLLSHFLIQLKHDPYKLEQCRTLKKVHPAKFLSKEIGMS